LTKILGKLNKLEKPGKKLYFVRTKDMKRYADAEVKKERYKIDVEIIQ
jgi:hypothetical protein